MKPSTYLLFFTAFLWVGSFFPDDVRDRLIWDAACICSLLATVTVAYLEKRETP